MAHLDVRKLDLVAIGKEGVEPEDELVVTPEQARHATNHAGGVDGHSLGGGVAVSHNTARVGEVSNTEFVHIETPTEGQKYSFGGRRQAPLRKPLKQQEGNGDYSNHHNSRWVVIVAYGMEYFFEISSAALRPLTLL